MQPGNGGGTTAAPAPSAQFADLGVGVGTMDVRTWQTKMAQRGWDIRVDGIYGPQSKRICTEFQTQKNLLVDGIVGPQTWNATWDTPITSA